MIRGGRTSSPSLKGDRSRPQATLQELFFEELRGRIAPGSEARLALAVLEDAVGCLNGHQDPWKVPSRLFRWEAEQWMESRDRASLFSFENVCSILSLHADKVRWQIHRWHAGKPGRIDVTRG